MLEKDPMEQFHPPEPGGSFNAGRITALLAAARHTRSLLGKIQAGLAPYQPRRITDAAGNSFLALSAPYTVTTLDPGPGVPFAVRTFVDDATEQERWLPSPSSLLAYNGDIHFSPFDPVLGGTPISALTEDDAPAVLADGQAVFLKITFDPTSAFDPVEPVVVTDVEVHVQAIDADTPVDDLVSGTVYRPWFTLSAPDESGARTLLYQTLGYAHFWLFITPLHLDFPSDSFPSAGGSSSSSQSSKSSQSSSSGGSSQSSGSPASQSGAWLMDGKKRTWVTWGLLLRRHGWLRMTMQLWTIPPAIYVPEEFLQSIKDRRILHARARCAGPAGVHLGGPHFDSQGTYFTAMIHPFASGNRGVVTIILEGRTAGSPDEIEWTDDEGKERINAAWNTIP